MKKYVKNIKIMLLLAASSANLMSMHSGKVEMIDRNHQTGQASHELSTNQVPSAAEKSMYNTAKNAANATASALNSVVSSTGNAVSAAGKTVYNSAKSTYDAIPTGLEFSIKASDKASDLYYALPDVTGRLKSAGTSAYNAATMAKNAVMDWFKNSGRQLDTLNSQNKAFIKSIVDYASNLNPADAPQYVYDQLNKFFGTSKPTEMASKNDDGNGGIELIKIPDENSSISAAAEKNNETDPDSAIKMFASPFPGSNTEIARSSRKLASSPSDLNNDSSNDSSYDSNDPSYDLVEMDEVSFVDKNGNPLTLK